MYTSFALMALAGLLQGHIPLASSWEIDYRIARQAGEKQNKPLAVFVAGGNVNWQKLTREGQFNPDVQALLTRNYVRVFLDSDTEYGRKCAELFGLTGTTGLVISDRGGGYQAFRHDGLLSSKDLAKHLNRFADPDHVVQTTESNAPPPAITTIGFQNPYGQCLT